ncbi:uncharacterized protein LOC126891966 isoform X2 [Diabrotica virgifera virgifera]|uniref:Uncharacterized protein n=1 Tax=Diabrotica virgifera virgifera TaxID=50390 RepID=A0ABM5L4C0_DIAVI|nr:uncharacterized protein LOC126891966 isoform X2 [Diabrotica virgifera virgifera]
MEERDLVSNRRRSLHNYGEEKPVCRKFPDNDEQNFQYPPDYIHKVNTETEKWNAHLSNILVDQQRYKEKIRELKTVVYNENVLSHDQQEFLKSIDFNTYLRQTEIFCKKVHLAAELYSFNKSEKYQELQKTIEHVQEIIDSKLKTFKGVKNP